MQAVTKWKEVLKICPPGSKYYKKAKSMITQYGP